MAETTSDEEQLTRRPPSSALAAAQPAAEPPLAEWAGPAPAASFGPGLGSPDGYQPRAADARFDQNVNRQPRVDAVLAMQRQLGNQRVQRLMGRAPAAGAAAPVQRQLSGTTQPPTDPTGPAGRPAAAPACAPAAEDFNSVGPAGPQLGLQNEIGRIEVSSFAADYFKQLDELWMSYGEAGARIYLHQLLQRMWMEAGPQLVDQFVDHFTYRVQLIYSAGPGASDPAGPRLKQVSQVLAAEQKQVHAEAEQFLACFEEQAIAMANGALDDSAERVSGELKHYFGSNLLVEFAFGSDPAEGQGEASEKQDEASKRGLGIAAEGLARRRAALIKANTAYRSSVRTGASLTLAEREPIEQAQVQASNDYELFRRQVIPRFPILEQFAAPDVDPLLDEDAEPDDEQGEQLNTLAQLAHGPATEDASRVIFDQVSDKLKNIAKIREELKPGGEVTIWRVPKIFEATRDLNGAKPGTFYGKLIDDKVAEEPPRSLTSRLVEILEIGLYALAPFTEGLTLIPAVAITTGRAGYRVYEHYKEYTTQQALHGTDFGGAALSADDPSLFWLGADIAAAFVEVGLSVAPALEVFRGLAPAARAARAAAAGAEAVDALESAARELTTKELGAEKAAQLGERVAADARAAQGSGLAGMTADEARLLAEADAQAGRRAAGALARLPVGARLPAAADQALGAAVEAKLSQARATSMVEAARTAMRAGKRAEAELLFSELEEHLTAEEANLLWRDLAETAEAATRLEEPITLFGEQHILKLMQGEDGAHFVLCSWCTQVRDVLQDALEQAKAAGNVDAARVSRLEELIRQVQQLEANVNTGKVAGREATSRNMLRTLLGKLTESEHLIGTELQELAPRLRPNFTKLALDDKVAERAAELYSGYRDQLLESRRDIFRMGKADRAILQEELEKEAQARALTQAQTELHGAPQQLAPGAPARTVIDPLTDVPFGFYDRPRFDEFSRHLYAALGDLPDTELVMEGSGVTGRRYERIVDYAPTGSPFDVGRISDYDIAIESDSLFAEAKRLKLVTGNQTATGELSIDQLKKLGLGKLETEAEKAVLEATEIAHPVKFKVRPASGGGSGSPSLRLPP